MATLEQKIDLVMEYITTDDKKLKANLKKQISELLASEDSVPNINTPVLYKFDDIVEDLLKDIGVPCHLKGHDYIVTAIKLIISDQTYVDHISYRLYPDVGKAHNTTGSRVERAIRHAIETAVDRGDLDRLGQYFGNTISRDRGKPVNSEFLATCTRIVQRKMRG